MAKSLYICYFGVNEPLVQTQVIPYLRELVKGGHEVSLLTFEGQATQLQNYGEAKLKKELAELRIDWYWLKYHKRFSALATAYDVFRGTLFVRRMIGRKKLEILHGRVHVPTLMGALARKSSWRKPKLLFDIRGFFPEEYTDAGVWPENGILYRSAKRVERWLLKEADGFVVLTEKARDILFPEITGTAADVSALDRSGRPVEIIPCCVDLTKFSSANGASRAEMRRKLGVEDRFVVTYVGSFGGWYLTDEMMELFQTAKTLRNDTFVLILTQRDKDKIAAELRDRGFGHDDFSVRSVPPTEVPRYLGAADLAVSFIKACYSKQSSSPTKIAEYLACGLPILANSGVGDVDATIENNSLGAIVDSFDNAAYIKGFRKVSELTSVPERARGTAAREFDLQTVGGERYRRLYNNIMRGPHKENEDDTRSTR
jgi:glycosyltransferase involved in cell wall biosynthesis